MPTRLLCALALLSTLVACGGEAAKGSASDPGTTPTPTPTPTATPTAPACVPACAGKTCGSDGCGGVCGTCATGQTCTSAGACQTPPPQTQTSINCPAGQYCTYLERTAVKYACTSLPNGTVDCEPAGQWGTYPTYEQCRIEGCENGNSTCGQQFGAGNVELVAACETCTVGCETGVSTLCPDERVGGCNVGDWGLVTCICQ